MNEQGPNGPPDDVSLAEVHERVTDAVFALDDEWQFTYLNEQAEEVLRRDEEDLLGTVIWDEFSEAVGSTFQEGYERAMATQTPVTFEEFYPPLETWFEVRAYPSETGLSVYFSDISERVRQRNRLEGREEALRRAYEVIGDPDRSLSQQIDALLEVVRDTVDTDYATLSRVTGDTYRFEAIAAPDDADLSVGDTVPLETTNCERVVATEQTLVLNDVAADAPELADREGNAEWGISSYLGAPVFVGGDVYGTFCFYDMEAREEDFTEWEVTFVELLSNWVSSELERERQRDRLESFAGMLAHELRNPLNVAQIYQSQAAEGDDDAAREVATALDRIEELIDVILVIARDSDSSVEQEPVAVADAAAEAWDDVTTTDAELAVETDLAVESDPVHVRHLLENLFSNSVEHGRSDVTIRVGDLDGGFYVEDDGPGIPEDERERVFEAGYTTDEGGIGLGLTFVAQIADTYDWDLLVTESEEGGTRFEFTGVEPVGDDTP